MTQRARTGSVANKKKGLDYRGVADDPGPRRCELRGTRIGLLNG